jgi:hypothetical protein
LDNSNLNVTSFDVDSYILLKAEKQNKLNNSMSTEKEIKQVDIKQV